MTITDEDLQPGYSLPFTQTSRYKEYNIRDHIHPSEYPYINTYLEEGKIRPYTEKRANIDDELIGRDANWMINSLTKDVEELEELYQQVTSDIRKRMIESGYDFEKYFQVHESVYHELTKDMSRLEKDCYGSANFQMLGKELCNMLEKYVPSKGQNIEGFEDVKWTIKDIHRAMDKDKLATKRQVFTPTQIDELNKKFDDMVIVETEKYEKEQKEKQVELNR